MSKFREGISEIRKELKNVKEISDFNRDKDRPKEMSKLREDIIDLRKDLKDWLRPFWLDKYAKDTDIKYENFPPWLQRIVAALEGVGIALAVLGFVVVVLLVLFIPFQGATRTEKTE